MIPVTYGYARVSKTERDDRNLETQLQRLAGYRVRQELVFSDTASGRTMQRRGWQQLMDRVQEGDTIVVVWLDRFSRDFDEGLRIQAELTERGIGIVAITENINTADDSAAAKYFRRMMMDNGAYPGREHQRADPRRLGTRPPREPPARPPASPHRRADRRGPPAHYRGRREHAVRGQVLPMFRQHHQARPRAPGRSFPGNGRSR